MSPVHLGISQGSSSVFLQSLIRKLGLKSSGDDYRYQEGLSAYNLELYATALEKWIPLAEQGDPRAQFDLGAMYQFGISVPKDLTLALKWYRKSEEQGNSDAQCNLGNMYYKGEGVSQDYTLAFKLYRKSAKRADADAQFNLGQMYYEGLGVIQDYKRARKWYKKSAQQGHAGANLNLGVMYAEGIGVRKAIDFAYVLFDFSASIGSQEGKNNRVAMENLMTSEEIRGAKRAAIIWSDNIERGRNIEWFWKR